MRTRKRIVALVLIVICLLATVNNNWAEELIASESNDTSLGDLVQDAVDSAEEASEAAGVEYYGKDRTGMLGNRLWYADIGGLIPSDSDFEPAIALSSGFNFPVSKHFDISFGIGYSKQKGTYSSYETQYYTDIEYYWSYDWWYGYRLNSRPVRRSYNTWVTYDVEIDTLSLLSQCILSIAPESTFNPFLHAGAFYLDQEVSVSGYGVNVSDGGIIYGGGAEMRTSDKTSLILNASRIEVDDAEDTSIGALFAYWYAHNHAMRFSAAYSTETENYTASLGWMYGH